MRSRTFTKQDRFLRTTSYMRQEELINLFDPEDEEEMEAHLEDANCVQTPCGEWRRETHIHWRFFVDPKKIKKIDVTLAPETRH